MPTFGLFSFHFTPLARGEREDKRGRGDVMGKRAASLLRVSTMGVSCGHTHTDTRTHTHINDECRPAPPRTRDRP